MSRCRTKPFVGARLTIAQSRTSLTRLLADRHRPADRVQGQTDDLPIGIDLPIGLDQTEDLPIGIKLPIGSRPKTRGLADRHQQTTIARSGYREEPTPGRLGAES